MIYNNVFSKKTFPLEVVLNNLEQPVQSRCNCLLLNGQILTCVCDVITGDMCIIGASCYRESRNVWPLLSVIYYVHFKRGISI